MGWTEQLFEGPYAKQFIETADDTERTASEAAFIIHELRLRKNHRVLDLACGPGRHALAVAPNVAEVVGSDLTASYLDYARAWAEREGIANVSFVQEDMRDLAYDAEFDAAYNYFTAWGYYDAETNLDVLRRVCRALKPGGQFLLEIIGRDALMRRYDARDWSQDEGGVLALYNRCFDVVTGMQHSTQTYVPQEGAPEVIEIVHQIPAPDHLALLFKLAGFAETRVVSAPDSGEAGIDSFRIAVIGTR